MRPSHEGYLGANEITVLIIIFITTKVFLTFPQGMVEVGRTSAWVMPIVSVLSTFPGVWATCVLLRSLPGLSIVEASELLLGKWLGGVAAVLIALTFIGITSMILRQFTESIVTETLPETPVSVVALLFMAAVTYGAYAGMEVMARMAWLVFPWIVAGVVVILALSLTWADYHRLFPPLGADPRRMVLAATLRFSMFGDVIILGLVFPLLRPQARPLRLATLALLTYALITSTILAILVATFSVVDAGRQVFPVFQLSRLIHLGRFVQRIEAIFILLWVIGGLIKLSVSLYGAAASLGRFLQLPMHQPLVFPLAVISFALSFWPKDISAAVHLDQSLVRTWAWIPGLALPLLLLAIKALQERRLAKQR